MNSREINVLSEPEEEQLTGENIPSETSTRTVEIRPRHTIIFNRMYQLLRHE